MNKLVKRELSYFIRLILRLPSYCTVCLRAAKTLVRLHVHTGLSKILGCLST